MVLGNINGRWNYIQYIDFYDALEVVKKRTF